MIFLNKSVNNVQAPRNMMYQDSNHGI